MLPQVSNPVVARVSIKDRIWVVYCEISSLTRPTLHHAPDPPRGPRKFMKVKLYSLESNRDFTI